MTTQPKTLNRTLVNLVVDGGIFIAFLITTAPRFSGIAIHEWLSIAFAAATVAHLLLHWSWIIQVARRFFGKVTTSSRINYGLNTLLFIDVTILMATGLLISQVALPLFGIRLGRDALWLRLHTMTSDGAVFLTGLHLALHWSWIVNATKRAFGKLPRRQTVAQHVTAHQEVQS